MKTEPTNAAQDLQATREKIADNLAAATEGATKFVKDLGARSLHDAREALSDARVAVSDGGEEVAGMARAFVRDHPIKALSIAVAAGLLAGVLLTRRSP
jgi:ElaB/YqjD/DUF883 family membrane-anchored ribosome-binding protein